MAGEIDDKNADYDEILINAAKNGDFKKVKLAIEKGAYIETRGDKGYTPLMFASDRTYTKIAKYLIEKGANVNARDYLKRTPLTEAAYSGGLEIVKALVGGGADVNAHGQIGFTAFMFACQQGRFSIAKYLYKKGAEINATSDSGKENGAVLCAMNGHTEILKWLSQLKEFKITAKHKKLMELLTKINKKIGKPKQEKRDQEGS